MFDHMGIYTGQDLNKVGAFYAAVLAPLGITLQEDHTQPDGTGRLVFSAGKGAFFVVAKGDASPPWWRADQKQGASAIHLCFSAPSKAAVDAFHAIGLQHGGRDNGAPGVRRPGYYGAYLADLDSNGIKAGFRGS